MKKRFSFILIFPRGTYYIQCIRWKWNNYIAGEEETPFSYLSAFSLGIASPGCMNHALNVEKTSSVQDIFPLAMMMLKIVKGIELVFLFLFYNLSYFCFKCMILDYYLDYKSDGNYHICARYKYCRIISVSAFYSFVLVVWIGDLKKKWVSTT